VEVAAVGTETQGVTNFPVTVELLDADEAVRPEMTAAVDIVTSEVDDVLLIPNRAIRLLDGERVIYVLTESPEKLTQQLKSESQRLPIFKAGDSPLNAIIPIPVTLGSSSSLYSEVLSGDLEEGDLVVLNPPADGSSGAGESAVRIEIQP
jgi:HlyD family secretion protein